MFPLPVRSLLLIFIADLLASLAAGRIVVEKYERASADYLLAKRTTDTIVIKNIGDQAIYGFKLPSRSLLAVRYYDELGSIFRKKKNEGMHLFGLRYPLRKGERIKLTVDRLSGRGSREDYLFEDEFCLHYSEENTFIGFFPRRRQLKNLVLDSCHFLPGPLPAPLAKQ